MRAFTVNTPPPPSVIWRGSCVLSGMSLCSKSSPVKEANMNGCNEDKKPIEFRRLLKGRYLNEYINAGRFSRTW
jgi:hypothetical protein